MNHLSTLVLIALPLALARSGFAEDPPALGAFVEFETIGGSVYHDGPAEAGQTVVRRAAELKPFAALLYAEDPSIDWKREAVAVVALGAQPGRHHVEVQRVVRTPISAERARLEVRYRRSSSGAATDGTSAACQLVTFAAGPEDVIEFVDVDAAPHQAAVTYVELTRGLSTIKLHTLTGDLELSSSVRPESKTTRATPSEVQRIAALAVRAEAGSLPEVLEVDRDYGLLVRPWTLRIVSRSSELDGATGGPTVGVYGAHAGRVAELIDRMLALLVRFEADAAPQSPRHTGTLRVSKAGVQLVSADGSVLALRPEETARELRAFDGAYAELHGRRSGDALDVEATLAPHHLGRTYVQVHRDEDGELALLGVPYGARRAVGPLAKVVTRGVGKKVAVDAWLLGPPGARTGTHVTALRASVPAGAPIYASVKQQAETGRVPEGMHVLVTRANRAGTLVGVARTKGWIPASALEVGTTLAGGKPHTPGIVSGLDD